MIIETKTTISIDQPIPTPKPYKKKQATMVIKPVTCVRNLLHDFCHSNIVPLCIELEEIIS